MSQKVVLTTEASAGSTVGPRGSQSRLASGIWVPVFSASAVGPGGSAIGVVVFRISAPEGGIGLELGRGGPAELDGAVRGLLGFHGLI